MYQSINIHLDSMNDQYINAATQVSQALLRANAIIYCPRTPVTFQCGILSPIYIDNRMLLSHPSEWKSVLEHFQARIRAEKIDFDVIAGTGITGVHFSSTLAVAMEEPAVFIRNGVRSHGTRSRIEGGSVRGKQVLFVHDHITTGQSTIDAVQRLRDAGGEVLYCLSITSMDFVSTELLLSKHHIQLHTLTTFPLLMKEAIRSHRFSPAEREIIDDWHSDPIGWSKKQGFYA